MLFVGLNMCKKILFIHLKIQLEMKYMLYPGSVPINNFKKHVSPRIDGSPVWKGNHNFKSFSIAVTI